MKRIKRIKKSENLFLENSYKIDNLLVTLTNEKREKTNISKTKSENVEFFTERKLL